LSAANFRQLIASAIEENAKKKERLELPDFCDRGHGNESEEREKK